MHTPQFYCLLLCQQNLEDWLVAARALSKKLAHDSKLLGQIVRVAGIFDKLYLGAVGISIEVRTSAFQGDFG